MKDKAKSKSPLIGERLTDEKLSKSLAAFERFLNECPPEKLDVMIAKIDAMFEAKEDSLPEATYEQSDIKILADLVEILYEANGTGSGAGDIQDYIKKHFVRKVESKEDNKAFGEQDLEAAFKAGMAYDYYLGLKMQYASAKPFPNFKEWLKTRIEKQTI